LSYSFIYKHTHTYTHTHKRTHMAQGSTVGVSYTELTFFYYCMFVLLCIEKKVDVKWPRSKKY